MGINTYNYNHPRSRCLNASIRTQSIVGRETYHLQNPDPMTANPEHSIATEVEEKDLQNNYMRMTEVLKKKKKNFKKLVEKITK